jgi:predicted RNA binding protein YcfA (HicA-like mRNA interferase family)
MRGHSEEPMKVRDLIRLLENEGWHLARTRGSHRQYKHDTRRGTVTVAGRPGLDLPPKTASSVLRQAGLETKE